MTASAMSTRRQTARLTGEARMNEIRTCIRLGTHEATAIACAMGVTRELVYYYAKRMPDIERREGRSAENRVTSTLHLVEVPS